MPVKNKAESKTGIHSLVKNTLAFLLSALLFIGAFGITQEKVHVSELFSERLPR